MKTITVSFLLTLLMLGAVFVKAGLTPLTSTPTDPASLLPASSFLVFHSDGYQKHQPAVSETAAWKALKDSGLEDRIFDIFRTVIDQTDQGQGASDLFLPAVRHVMNYGGSFAATVSASGDDISPLAMIVLPEGDASSQELQKVLKFAQEKGKDDLRQKEIQGRSVSFNESPGQPGLEIAFWHEGGNVVVAIGMDAARQIIQTAEGQHASLAGNARWSALRESDKFTVDYLGWLDTKPLLTQFGGMPIPNSQGGEPLTIGAVAEWLGLSNLNGMTFHGGYSGAETWSHSELSCDGAMTGLLSLLQQKPLTLADLPPLPPECSSFGAARFDLQSALNLVLQKAGQAVEQMDGARAKEQFDQGLAGAVQFLGLNSSDELSLGLGDIWCAYADTAALPIPIGISPGIAISIRDRDTLLMGLDRLILLAESMPDSEQFSIRKSSKNGNLYISVSINQLPILVPTMVVTQNWLVAGVTPATAQGFVMRAEGKLPSWKPNAQVAEALAELPADFSSITISDPAPGYRQMLSYAPMAMAMAESQILPDLAPGAKLPFGVEDIPNAEIVTASMFPNVAVGVPTPEGIVNYSRSSVPANPLGGIASTTSVPILVALLLPAVQQAREAARRTQSKNNLKQLALAMHNYHAVYNHFPRGTVDSPGLEPDDRVGWVYPLLPYMEQFNLYNQLPADEIAKGWRSKNLAMGNISQTAIATLQNPSTPRREASGSMDYVGISGIGPNSAALPGNDKRAGVFGYDRVTRLRDIHDGTSNTLMIGDSAVPNASFLAGGKESVRGFSQKPYLNGPDNIGSPHPGVVQFCLADGSVRTISVEVEDSVLEALATKAGGEIVGDF